MNAAAKSSCTAGSLLAPLGDPHKAIRSGATRALASEALRDPRVRDALRAGLARGDERVRFSCAIALAHAGQAGRRRNLVEILCGALDAADSDTRWAAAAALARVGGAARKGLREAARTGSPRARRMALYSLRGLGGRHECGLGATAARASEAGVRLAALALIGERARGCARCAQTALRMLARDGSVGVRRAAATALGKVGVDSPAIRTALGAAARSADNGLARAARGALGRLGTGSSKPPRGASLRC